METNFQEKSKNLSKQKTIIRITRTTLKNFKNVLFGEIELNCGRSEVPYDCESDVLGLYGQNASGKSTFIDALEILKKLLSGEPLDKSCSNRIGFGKDFAELEFEFGLLEKFEDEVLCEYRIVYSFKLARNTCVNTSSKNNTSSTIVNGVIVYDEKLYVSRPENNDKKLLIDTSTIKHEGHTVLDTIKLNKENKSTIINPKTNEHILINNNESMIFKDDLYHNLKKHFYSKDFPIQSDEKIIEFILYRLRKFAVDHMYILKSNHSGDIWSGKSIPLFTPEQNIVYYDLKRVNKMNLEDFGPVSDMVKTLDPILNQMIPGLHLEIVDNFDNYDMDDDIIPCIILSNRDGVKTQLKYESDGVKRIVAILMYLKLVFNDPSALVAIDELDSGIYEHLLGELLAVIVEEGRGQLIFTSHNLRPLEVIGNKFIYFTTTNAENRYTLLNELEDAGNMRDSYLREILIQEKENKISNEIRRSKIADALRQPNHSLKPI